MAMDPTAMAALIKTNVEAISGYPEAGKSPVFVDDRILVAICKGIIDHIKAAEVVVSQGANGGGPVTSTSISIS